jgi:hypothetical protein
MCETKDHPTSPLRMAAKLRVSYSRLESDAEGELDTRERRA